MKPIDIINACVAANHPNDGVNEMTIGKTTVHVCDDCLRAYSAAKTAERKARTSAPRRRQIAATGRAGEWNAFVALALAVSAGTLPAVRR
jgi:hypothetical protein